MGWIWKRGQRRAEELDEEVRGHLEMAAGSGWSEVRLRTKRRVGRGGSLAMWNW